MVIEGAREGAEILLEAGLPAKRGGKRAAQPEEVISD
jgi:hypothetical protein